MGGGKTYKDRSYAGNRQDFERKTHDFKAQ